MLNATRLFKEACNMFQGKYWQPKMELTKIKMSEAKVYYCSGWGVDYPGADSVL